MNWFFDMDKPLMRGLSVVTDLILLNIFTILCSIPVFTAGAAFTAAYTVIIRTLRNEEGGLVKDYFRAFASNFKEATLLWLGFLLAIAVLIFDYIAVAALLPQFIPVIAALSLIVLVFGFYAFGLLARYENPLRITLKNAAMLAIGYFPKTVGMVVFSVVFWLGSIQYFHVVGPILLLFGLSLPIYVTTILMNGIFMNLDNKE